MDTHMFCKDYECIKLLGQSEDESRVVHESLNWTFVASVEEHGTRAIPVIVCTLRNCIYLMSPHGSKPHSNAGY